MSLKKKMNIVNFKDLPPDPTLLLSDPAPPAGLEEMMIKAVNKMREEKTLRGASTPNGQVEKMADGKWTYNNGQGSSYHSQGIARDISLEQRNLLEDVMSKGPLNAPTYLPPPMSDAEVRKIVRDEMTVLSGRIRHDMEELFVSHYEKIIKEFVEDLNLTVGTLSDQVDEIWEELRDA